MLPIFEIAVVMFYTLIIAAVISIFVLIGKYIGHADNTDEIKTSLTTAYSIGGVIFGLLVCIQFAMKFGISMINDELLMTCMVYLAFFMAYMAMSISLINIKYS